MIDAAVVLLVGPVSHSGQPVRLGRFRLERDRACEVIDRCRQRSFAQRRCTFANPPRRGVAARRQRVGRCRLPEETNRLFISAFPEGRHALRVDSWWKDRHSARYLPQQIHAGESSGARHGSRLRESPLLCVREPAEHLCRILDSTRPLKTVCEPVEDCRIFRLEP